MNNYLLMKKNFLNYIILCVVNEYLKEIELKKMKLKKL